jgi:hypothetical protein
VPSFDIRHRIREAAAQNIPTRAGSRQSNVI